MGLSCYFCSGRVKNSSPTHRYLYIHHHFVQPAVSRCNDWLQVTCTPTDFPPLVLPFISQSPQLTSIGTAHHPPVPAVTIFHHQPVPAVTTPHHLPVLAVTIPHHQPVPAVTIPHHQPVPAVTTPHHLPVLAVTIPRHPPVPAVTTPRHQPVPAVTTPRTCSDNTSSSTSTCSDNTSSSTSACSGNKSTSSFNLCDNCTKLSISYINTAIHQFTIHTISVITLFIAYMKSPSVSVFAIYTTIYELPDINIKHSKSSIASAYI